jgi:hypothetical protein
LFGRRGESNKPKWKTEYEYTVYKVYDWNKNLAGYFFPKYSVNQSERLEGQVDGKNVKGINEELIIENLHKTHRVVKGGNLMVPMIKLDLLDKPDGVDISYAINSLQQNLQRMTRWEEWLAQNYSEFKIIGSAVYTAREDRNMLSIVLGIDSDITLGEKEVCVGLSPLLNRLHEDGML